MDDVSRAIDIIRFPINQEQTVSNLHDDPLLQLYYRNFHASHPFLPPFEFLTSALARDIPPFLLSIMRAIGAQYGQDTSLVARLRHSTAPSRSSHDSPIDRGFQVQYLLLTSIIEHAHGHNEYSHHALAEAITLALELGMNEPSFSHENSLGFCVLEESWRRTYWELYVVNGFIAATRNLDTFTLHEVDCNLMLPCDENEYQTAGAISPQPTLEELHKSSILLDERQLSSFAYRIRAVHILGLVLSLHSEGNINTEMELETINAYITGLYFEIPPPRRELYGVDGKVDEMIFQTLIVLHMSTVYLHHPLGNIRLASPQRRISCSQIQQSQQTQTNLCGPPVPDIHSRKVMDAVDSVLNMVTISRSIKQTTPFFMCAIVVSIIVQITSGLASGKDPKLKERSLAKIRLGLGALKVLSELWPLAKLSKDELVNLCQAAAI
ncbi:SCF ubiquitin ligase complex subunit [Paecilomyces lecythidis]